MTAVRMRTVALEALLGFVAALLSIAGRGDGRATRRSLAVRQSDDWSAEGLSEGVASRRCLLSADGVDDVTRTQLAAAWLDCACEAHSALVRSSQRALDLLSLGAPVDLVTRAHEDVLDEIRRVRVYFGVARGIDGKSAVADGGLPRRSMPRARAAALALLATQTVVDAFAVTRASKINAKLARRTTDPAIRRALEEIASNEARRLVHAWAIVRCWCTAEGGGTVHHALGALISRLPAMRRSLPPDARDGGWERWGIAGAALELQEHERARELVERALHELVSTSPTRGRLAAA